MKSFKIKNKNIGDNNRCFVIAEVAQAHDGSLGFAHSFIDLASNSGVDAIKFQTHIASEESTYDEEFRVNFSYEDKTRFDYWERMEFSPNQWKSLASYAESKGLIFLSSPFSVEAVKILDEINVPAWKIGSGELGNFDMLEHIASTKKPVLISSGMSTFEEISKTIDFLRECQNDIQIGLFQCTTEYPTQPENIGLNLINELKLKFNCPVGLSDHSGDMIPPIAAMAIGANMIEAHICFSKNQFGPDSSSSLTENEFKEVCRARDLIFTMNENPVKKDDIASELSATSKAFSRSAALSSPQKKGTILTSDMIKFKKPGTGINQENIKSILGKSFLNDVGVDRLLKPEDFQ